MIAVITIRLLLWREQKHNVTPSETSLESGVLEQKDKAADVTVDVESDKATEKKE